MSIHPYALCDLLADPHVLLDRQGVVLRVNAAFAGTFGWSDSELAGSPFLPLVHHQDVPEFGKAMQQAAAGVSPEPVQARIRCRDSGSTQHIWILRGNPAAGLVLAGGYPAPAAAGRDADPPGEPPGDTFRRTRKSLEEQLHEVGTFRDVSGGILRVLCHDLGWDLGEIWLRDPRTGTFSPLVSWHEPGQEGLAEFSRRAATLAPQESDSLASRAGSGGVPLWVENLAGARLGPHVDLSAEAGLSSALAFPAMHEGRLVAVVCLYSRRQRARDDAALRRVAAFGVHLGLLASKKDLEAQFLQAQKMEAIGRLAGGVAHDFNNILTAIQGYSELALEGLEAGHPVASAIREVSKAADRAAELTRQLLAFSRRQVITPRVVEPAAIVRNLESLIRRLIGEDVSLRLAIAPDVPNVRVDPGQLEQVLMNLVVNARDAMPKGGQLTIEVRPFVLDQASHHVQGTLEPGSYVVIAVTDNGEGMTPEVLRRLFEPFFTTKSPGKGTGLGLATVHGIVTQSGGFIRVYSEPGRGSTFNVYLPRCHGSAPPTPRQGIPVLPQKGTGTILLVEDEPAVLNLASRCLRSAGYTVLATTSGDEAIDIADRAGNPIDLLVTDVILPGLNGPTVAGRIAARRPGLPVLFVSGYTRDALGHQGVLDEDVAFLQKPYQSRELVARVAECLARPNLARPPVAPGPEADSQAAPRE